MAKQSKTSKDVVPGSVSWLTEPWRGVDRLFEDFLDRRFPAFPSLLAREGRMGFLSPNVDIKEDDKTITVSAELPGLDPDDVEVTLRDGVLTLKGEKKLEDEKSEDNYRVTERRYGSFQRSFQLPDTVDEEKVTASFDKGVLTIELPKRAEAARAAKKIKIGTKGGK
ncbi:MAG: Hsp20/alpha crystallin family protein [Alphaproteobacteria bacterium]|nr:MAG: Hsp20/alpha crystallin family protein [Alphaproteobacteria bacterium]